MLNKYDYSYKQNIIVVTFMCQIHHQPIPHHGK